MRGWRAALASLFAAPLAACIVVSGDLVFVPHDPGYAADSEDTLSVAGEGLYDPDTEVRTRDGTLLPNLEPAKVEHGFLPYGTGNQRLAWTLISRPAEDGAVPRPLVVHCGGNATSRYRGAVIYSRKIIDRGDMLMFDYPGTGDTDGPARFASFEAAADSVATFADNIAGEDRPLVFWGHSLGGFVCARMAGQLAETDGMIFETSARNIRQVIHAWKPWHLFFVGVRVDETVASFDNVDALKGFGGPVLVLAGSEDKTLPPELSTKLFRGLERAGHNVSVEVFDAGHSGVPRADGFDTVVDGFFDGL